MLAIAALLLATPITVNSAAASRTDGQLSIEVHAAEGQVAAARVAAQLEPRRLVLLVANAQLEHDKDRQTFHENHRYIQARRNGTSVELEIPIGSNVACSGPVALAERAYGALASVSCATAKSEQPAAAAALQPVAAAVAPEPKLAADRAEAPAPAQGKAPATPREAPRSVPVERAAGHSAAVAETPVSASGLPAGLDRADERALPLASATAPASSTPGVAGFIALFVLAAGAGVAILRKRAPRIESALHVLETINVGPRQKLILARVRGETLLLGASEAGITVLSGKLSEAALVEASAGQPAQPAAAGSESMAPRAAGGSLSARLRGLSAYLAHKPAAEQPGASAKHRRPADGSEPSFDLFFAESAEDQDLLEKLQRGHAARVQ